MYRALLCASLGLVMLLAVSANAREVAISVENRIGGDGNVLRTTDRTKADGYWEFVPKVIFRERNRELRYDFQYTPIYESFFKTDGIDGWDHIESGRFDWDLTPRDTLGFSQEYADTRRLRQESREAFGGSAPIVEETDRDRIRRAAVSVYYSHYFTPRLSGRVSLDFSDIDFNSPFDIDTRAYGGSVSGQYVLSDQVTIGLYGSGRYRENRGVGLQASSRSAVGNVALSIASDLANLWNGLEMSVQAGPSVIQTQADNRTGATVEEFVFSTDGQSVFARAIDAVGGSCNFEGQDLLLACPSIAFNPNFPPTFSNPSGLVTLGPPVDASGLSNTDVSYFAEAKLTKSWELTKLYLTYTRSESASSGVATSSILDVVSGRLTYAPSAGWFFSFIADWTQRQFVQEVVQSVVPVVLGDPLILDPAVPSGFFFAQAGPDRLTTIVTTNGGSSDQTSWSTTFSAKRQLSKQITLLSYFRYQETDSQTEVRNSNITTIFGYVGLRYEFDPVVF